MSGTPTFDSISVDPELMSLQASQAAVQRENIEQSLASARESNKDAKKITFSTMEEFRAKLPEQYDAFMKAFMHQVQRSSQRASDRATAAIRRARSR